MVMHNFTLWFFCVSTHIMRTHMYINIKHLILALNLDWVLRHTLNANLIKTVFQVFALIVDEDLVWWMAGLVCWMSPVHMSNMRGIWWRLRAPCVGWRWQNSKMAPWHSGCLGAPEPRRREAHSQVWQWGHCLFYSLVSLEGSLGVRQSWRRNW